MYALRRVLVAPPRGERGLKFVAQGRTRNAARVAPPRGERGLKCVEQQAAGKTGQVAPPRGERGLKLWSYPLCGIDL